MFKHLALVCLLALSTVARADDLDKKFASPPDSAKPRTWWHWISGNISKDGITKDLEAMKRIGVGGAQCSVSLSVDNTGPDAFGFTVALHSYLRVHDLRNAELAGLHGGRYRESSAPGDVKFDRDEVMHVGGEIDRVYMDAPSRLTLREPQRELIVATEGFPDVVVWNPGVERAAGMKDMERGGEQRMLCVEAAAVQTPVTLDPGRRWNGSQTLIAQQRESQSSHAKMR